MKNRLIAGLSAVVFAAAIFTGTAEAGTKSKISLSTEHVKNKKPTEQVRKKRNKSRKAQVSPAYDRPGGGPDQEYGAAVWGADLVCTPHCQG